MKEKSHFGYTRDLPWHAFSDYTLLPWHRVSSLVAVRAATGNVLRATVSQRSS